MKEIIRRLTVKPFAVVGHRGAGGELPENTLKAFKHAVEVGADVVECDVRETADGELVVIHDPDFKRVAGVDKRVRELTLKEIKEKIRISGVEPVPTLKEVLSTVNGKCGLFIEIKEPETTEKVVKIVKSEVEKPNWIAFISFYPEALKRTKEIDKELTTGLIYSRPPGGIVTAKEIGAEIVLPRWPLSTEKAVRFAHRLKEVVVAWLIDDERSFERALKNGVDAMATDFPSWLVEKRREVGSSPI